MMIWWGLIVLIYRSDLMKSWYEICVWVVGMEVLIYDEIGVYGVSVKGFFVEFGVLFDGVLIDLWFNSLGGLVFDVVVIYNVLKCYLGEIIVWIDGIVVLVVSYIVMVGDEIVMFENVFLMIYDLLGLVMGMVVDMCEMVEIMDKIVGSMICGYVV